MKKDRKGIAQYWILGVLILLFLLTIQTGESITEDLLEFGEETEEAQNRDAASEKEKIKDVLAVSYEVTPEDISEEEYWDSMELLALCVEAEAGNQPLDGRRMVADVILNRVDHPGYPNTVSEVIGQPYRFSSYWDGNMDSIVEPSEETIRAVQMELEERSYPGLL